MKVIASYQQTFGTSTAVKSQSFKFQRVYKSNPDYKIMISVEKVTCFGLTGTNNEPKLLLLNGIPEISGKCNFQVKGNDVVNANDYVLGLFSDLNATDGIKSSTHVPQSAKFILNDLPLGEFNIRYEDIRLGAETFTEGLFIVSFLIDIVDMSF